MDAFKIVAARCPHARLDIVGSKGGIYPLEECFDLADEVSLRDVAPFFAKNPIALVKSKMGLKTSDQKMYLDLLRAKLLGELASKVTFHGRRPRSELIEHYYNSDVFVFPSIWNEGFGAPPVEAMAAGTPVVATRSGAITETVKDHETGFLLEKNDCHALADAILKLFENDTLRERMGRAARKRVLQLFQWDRIIAAMYDRYQSLCRVDSAANSLKVGYARSSSSQ